MKGLLPNGKELNWINSSQFFSRLWDAFPKELGISCPSSKGSGTSTPGRVFSLSEGADGGLESTGVGTGLPHPRLPHRLGGRHRVPGFSLPKMVRRGGVLILTCAADVNVHSISETERSTFLTSDHLPESRMLGSIVQSLFDDVREPKGAL